MSVFFAGRLITSPAVASVVDDSGLTNKNLTVGNRVAILGSSAGGKPNTVLRFGSPSQAKATLRSGALLDAILRAFDPSAEIGSPSEVIGIRVDPATQATLTLNDATPAASITLATTDYGLDSNQVKVKVESGTTSGKKLTTQKGNDYYTADNVGRNAFSIQYGGAQASAVMTINNTTVTLQAPTGSTVATIDLNVYNTVQKLVDRINVVASFTAAVLDGNGEKPSLNGLDAVTGVDVKTSLYTAKADLQACVDWFNGVGEGFLNATRAGTLVPANIAFTYLSGAVNGTITNTEWSNAYTVLQGVDVQWVVPASSSASIHAMNDAHCAFMSTAGRSERRGICGMASGTTDAAAIAAAKVLNSDRTSLVHLGMYDYNSAGALVLYEPFILAALIAGAFSAANPGTPMTNKTIKVRGLERTLRNPTDTDQLIDGGVMCVEETAEGFKVVQSITTWLQNDNYNRVEVSTGVCVDYVARQVRDKLNVLRGQKGSRTLLTRAVSITESTLREMARPEPQGPGIIVGDETNPAYKNISAELVGDVVRVQFECHPAIGVNYVLVSIFATAYTGTATA